MMNTVFLRIIGVVLIVLAGSLIVKNWNARQTVVQSNVWRMLEWASVMAGIGLILTARWDVFGILMLIMLPIIIIGTVLQMLLDYSRIAKVRILESWVRKAREKGNDGAIIRLCEQIAGSIRRGSALKELHEHNPNKNMDKQRLELQDVQNRLDRDVDMDKSKDT